MKDAPMPEPLRRAIHQLVSEAVLACQEVLRYTEPDVANRWEKMTLYRATDAADTLDMASLLIAAYCQRAGIDESTLQQYLQPRQQQSRAAGPQDDDRAHVAGMLDDPAPGDRDDLHEMRRQYRIGQYEAMAARQPEDDSQRLFTEACLHGLRARLCEDVDSLDSYLPLRIAAMARKVAEVLEEPQPAPA